MLDRDVLDFFKARARQPGAVPYQTQINRALHNYVPSVERGNLGRAAEASQPYSARAKTGKARAPGSRARPAARRPLQRTIKAVIRPGEQSGYVAECVELAIVSQGKTLDEVSLNLKEAVELHLENEDLEALGLAPDPVILVTLELIPAHA